MFHLGNIALLKGDLAQARAYLSQSADLLSELRYVYQGLSLANLCYVLRAQGDNQEARRNLARALWSGIEFDSMTPIMYCLPVAALFAVDEDRPKRALELYGAAQQFGHITNSRWFADVVCHELNAIRTSIPSDAAKAAEARGRELDSWQTASELIEDLTGTA